MQNNIIHSTIYFVATYTEKLRELRNKIKEVTKYKVGFSLENFYYEICRRSINDCKSYFSLSGDIFSYGSGKVAFCIFTEDVNTPKISPWIDILEATGMSECVHIEYISQGVSLGLFQKFSEVDKRIIHIDISNEDEEYVIEEESIETALEKVSKILNKKFVSVDELSRYAEECLDDNIRICFYNTVPPYMS